MRRFCLIRRLRVRQTTLSCWPAPRSSFRRLRPKRRFRPAIVPVPRRLDLFPRASFLVPLCELIHVEPFVIDDVADDGRFAAANAVRFDANKLSFEVFPFLNAD